MCSVPCNLVYRFLVGLSLGSFRNLTTKMAELLSINHHRVPRIFRRTIVKTLHSVPVCRCCSNTSGCYLNVNVSTPVFAYYSIIMCNYPEVSTDFLVVMEAY